MEIIKQKQRPSIESADNRVVGHDNGLSESVLERSASSSAMKQQRTLMIQLLGVGLILLVSQQQQTTKPLSRPLEYHVESGNNNNKFSNTTQRSDACNVDADPSSSSSYATRITAASTISSPAPGIDLYTNVCLDDDPWTIYSYNDALSDNIMKNSTTKLQTIENHILRTLSSDKPAWLFLRKTRFDNTTHVDFQASASNNIHIRTPTLFFVDLFKMNPAHCLSDTIFSLIALSPPSSFSSTDKNSSNTISSRPQDDDDQQKQLAASSSYVPSYHSYTYGYFGSPQPEFHEDCNIEKSWCCHIMKLAKMIPSPKMQNTTPIVDENDKGIPLPLPVVPKRSHLLDKNKKRIHKLICFNELIVPHYFEHRFTPDPNSLRELHTRLLENGRMLSDPWPTSTRSSLNASAHYIKNVNLPPNPPIRILLYDRKGSPRRRYRNSEEVVKYLQSKYNVYVHLLGEEWNNLSPSEQATLFNTYPNILSVHGAHLANLIYVRPYTKIIEIQCEIEMKVQKQIRTTQPSGATNSGAYLNFKYDPAWYGVAATRKRNKSQKWFRSFTRYLEGVEHFIFREKQGCIQADGTLDEYYSPQDFHIDPQEFGEYIAQRFGLEKKQLA